MSQIQGGCSEGNSGSRQRDAATLRAIVQVDSFRGSSREQLIELTAQVQCPALIYDLRDEEVTMAASPRHNRARDKADKICDRDERRSGTSHTDHGCCDY